jgi:hypothetical protein
MLLLLVDAVEGSVEGLCVHHKQGQYKDNRL